MKIVANTDSRLVLRHRPGVVAVLLAVWAVSLFWAALAPEPGTGMALRLFIATVGLGLLLVLHRYFPMTHTVFDRPSGVAVHSERRITGQRLDSWPLSDIAGAEVEAQRSGGSRGTRLTLRVGDRRYPLEAGFQPGDRRVAETAINEWLTRPVS